MELSLPFFPRHIIIALSLTIVTQIFWIYVIDTPKSIYHCPLNRNGLIQWTDENCYWSTSYAEAREKFVALGNALREQLAESGDALDMVDVKSISYDVSDDLVEKYSSYKQYIDTLNIVGGDSQNISPGKDTIDALLLTLRVPDDDKSNEDMIDLIHSSGVHGVEGYLGSAVQIRFLHELVNRNEDHLVVTNKSLATKYKMRRILLIHSVNPFGMRHHRRTNKNNVDLNRNALSEEEWEMIRLRDPNFAGYVDLDSVLNPFVPVDKNGLFSWVNAARSGGYTGEVSRLQQRDEEVREAASSEPLISSKTNNVSLYIEQLFDCWSQQAEIAQSALRLIRTMVTVGYTRTKRAFVSSQYLKQSGSQYGGGAHQYHNDEWEYSIYALKHAINKFADFNANNKVFWLDVHTGLGTYGEFSMLSTGSKLTDESSPKSEPAWIKRITARLNDSFATQNSSKDVSTGYDQTRGFVNGPVLCPLPNCFAKTQEFGTRPGVFVGMAMVLENKGYNTGKYDFAFSTSWAFNPYRLSWRRNSLKGGIEMLHVALNS